MKGLGWKLPLLFFVLGVISACGGKNQNNITPAGTMFCPPGYNCVNNIAGGNLAPGQTASYYGTLSGIVDSQAYYLAQAINGNFSNSGISFQQGDLTITAQGQGTGWTTYNVKLQIFPQGMSMCWNVNFWGGCNTTNPIIVQGYTNPPATTTSGAQAIQLVYSPGIKLNIISNTGFNDASLSTGLNQVRIVLVKNGQDPITGGDQLATSYLSRYY